MFHTSGQLTVDGAREGALLYLSATQLVVDLPDVSVVGKGDPASPLIATVHAG